MGADADFAIVETNGSSVLDADQLEYHDQEKWSPFHGMELRVYPGTPCSAANSCTPRARSRASPTTVGISRPRRR